MACHATQCQHFSIARSSLSRAPRRMMMSSSPSQMRRKPYNLNHDKTARTTVLKRIQTVAVLCSLPNSVLSHGTLLVAWNTGIIISDHRNLKGCACSSPTGSCHAVRVPGQIRTLALADRDSVPLSAEGEWSITTAGPAAVAQFLQIRRRESESDSDSETP
eukprot:2492833-Rhodomonas_salina.4